MRWTFSALLDLGHHERSAALLSLWFPACRLFLQGFVFVPCASLFLAVTQPTYLGTYKSSYLIKVKLRKLTSFVPRSALACDETRGNRCEVEVEIQTPKNCDLR